MSTEPSFGSGFGSPFGTPGPAATGVPGAGTGAPGPDAPSGGPRGRGRADATPWFRRREAVMAGAGLAVAAVLGTVAFVVLGGGDDDLATGGGTAAATRRPAATSIAATPAVAGRTGTRNPFSGQGAVQPGTTSGTTSTSAAAASTVYRTVKATVTSTKATTRTTTRTVTATVTASPTYVYFDTVTGADGDATFIVNGTSHGPLAVNATVVTNLKYLGTTGSSPNFCAQVSWKSGSTQNICLRSMARVDG